MACRHRSNYSDCSKCGAERTSVRNSVSSHLAETPVDCLHSHEVSPESNCSCRLKTTARQKTRNSFTGYKRPLTSFQDLSHVSGHIRHLDERRQTTSRNVSHGNVQDSTYNFRLSQAQNNMSPPSRFDRRVVEQEATTLQHAQSQPIWSPFGYRTPFSQPESTTNADLLGAQLSNNFQANTYQSQPIQWWQGYDNDLLNAPNANPYNVWDTSSVSNPSHISASATSTTHQNVSPTNLLQCASQSQSPIPQRWSTQATHGPTSSLSKHQLTPPLTVDGSGSESRMSMEPQGMQDWQYHPQSYQLPHEMNPQWSLPTPGVDCMPAISSFDNPDPQFSELDSFFDFRPPDAPMGQLDPTATANLHTDSGYPDPSTAYANPPLPEFNLDPDPWMNNLMSFPTEPTADFPVAPAYHTNYPHTPAATTALEAESATSGTLRNFRSDQFLVDSKRRGMSYKAIRELGGFTEAESTLRGRYRTLTKRKEDRLRRPVWTDQDVSFTQH